MGMIARSWVRQPRWQPIKTAPKDGRAVLVYEPWDEFDCGYCNMGAISLLCWHDGEWMDDMALPYNTPPEPTHWAPLPITPAYHQRRQRRRKEIASGFKAARKKVGLSQAAFGALVNLKPATVGRFENSHSISNASYRVLRAVVRKIGRGEPIGHCT